MDNKTTSKAALSALEGIKKIEMVPKNDISGVTSFDVRTPLQLPKELEGKNIDIRLNPNINDDTRTKGLDVFYAPSGVIRGLMGDPKRKTKKEDFKWHGGLDAGWVSKPIKNNNITIKKGLLEINHKKTGQSFIAVPLTQNHYDKRYMSDTHPDLKGFLIIPKAIIANNPGWNITLNHEQLPLTQNNSQWNIDSSHPASKSIRLVDYSSTKPDEIYLLNSKEIAEYEKFGKRNSWVESEKSTKSLRVFEKRKRNSVDQLEKCDERFAKPVKINGKQMYVLSTKKNINSIKIIPQKKDSQKTSTTPTSPIENNNPAQQTTGEQRIHTVEQKNNSTISPKLEILNKAYKLAQEEIGNNKEDRKDVYGHYQNVKKIIEEYEKDTSPEAKKNFKNKLTDGFDMASSSQTQNLYKSVLDNTITNTQNITSDIQNETPPTVSKSNQEQMANNAAGAVAGVVGGAIGGGAKVFGEGLKAIGSGFSNLINNHQKNKIEKLKNPELAAQEKEQATERITTWRKNNAHESNSAIDAKMDSALQSLQAIEKHPGIEKIGAMVDADPSQLNKAKDDIADVIANDPTLEKHYKNTLKSTKQVISGIEENLRLNQLAGNDLEGRKEKFEKFNENMSNHVLADTLVDEDENVTIRERLSQMLSQLKKFIEEIKMHFKGYSASETQETSNSSSPSM